MTRKPSRVATCGRPTENDVRSCTSRPAAAHRLATFDAWTSEPPASSSSRSRHETRWTRRRPDAATRSARVEPVPEPPSEREALVTAERWYALKVGFDAT